MKITEIYNELIFESYKLTFQDKQEIEKKIKAAYKSYISVTNKKNQNITIAKKLMSGPDKDVFKGTHFAYDAEQDIKKPMLYNQFYRENYESIKRDYINYKQRNSSTTFDYKSKKEDRLKDFNYREYYNSLTDLERENIDNFIDIVGERINSGSGESVNKTRVRDYFFKTPKTFQGLFSEKPSVYLWRGDDNHPCRGEDYDHEDKDYLSLQSFSTSKSVAKGFGFAFNASNIKSYSGSFSVPLYINFGGDFSDLGDDEGEVMFFDVEYKCKKDN